MSMGRRYRRTKHNPGPFSDPGLRDCGPVQLYFFGAALAGAVPPDVTGRVFGTS